MGDQHHGEPEFLLQLSDQADKAVRTVRIEAGGGFVEEQQFRLQGQGAGQRHALDHPPGQFRRHQLGMAREELDHGQLEHHQLADHVLVQHAQFAQGEGNVIENRQCGKQRALLEEHAETLAQLALAAASAAKQGLAEQADAARRRQQQADHLAQQGGLAAARAADQGDHLAAPDLQLQMPMHPDLAETRGQVRDLDHRRHGGGAHRGKPRLRVVMANTESSRITAVIAITTEAVVLADRLSVFGRTRRPK